MELKPGDLGYRRKRNIDTSDWGIKRQDKIPTSIGINWGDDQEQELEEDEETLGITEDWIEKTEGEVIAGARVNNKKINLEKLQSKEMVEEVEKVTVYLDRHLVEALKFLKKNKIIKSLSECIQHALEDYLY